jgi:ribosomal protein S18 acetylase RimI-like enzyme
MVDSVIVVEADFANPTHRQAVVDLVNAYARDPMGAGHDLPEPVQRELGPALQRHPASMAFVAFHGQEPVGVAVCFLGFSTFAARPLINIHDLAVKSQFRRLGVGRRLLEQVEAKARTLGCCKLTLEVHEDNRPAQGLYRVVGFDHAGQFWSKPLA